MGKKVESEMRAGPDVVYAWLKDGMAFFLTGFARRLGSDREMIKFLRESSIFCGHIPLGRSLLWL